MNAPTALVAVALALPAHADVRLPAVLSDGMVLQREAEVSIWGWAAPREEVRVTASFHDGALATRADDSGRWELALPTGEAGGPHEVVVAGSNELVLSDVWLGEVWIASGQSNMEWPMEGPNGNNPVRDSEAEIAAANDPHLRMFTVQRSIALEPLADCAGAWETAVPEHVRRWSATGYFFGRELRRELGVPIGIVHSSWGGTPCEAWTSRGAIEEHGGFDGHLTFLDELANATEQETLEERQAAWWANFDAREPGMQGGWFEASFDDSGWSSTTLPGLWRAMEGAEESGLDAYDGTLWYRRTIEVPEDWAGRPLELSLGAIDDQDRVWFDGRLVGSMDGPGVWNVAREYEVPAELTTAGEHVLTICCLDTGGAGGLSGEFEDLFYSVEGADRVITLAGPWAWERGESLGALGAWPRQAGAGSGHATVLFNGMIAPLVRYRVRGAIWYQGESNVGRAWQYRTLFPAMIRDWRAQWGQEELPFYFVQIAPFQYGNDRGQAAELREAQLRTLALPRTGMACLMDVGNPRDIHPNRKQEVGDRLARWALAKTYGRDDVVYSGPLLRSVRPEGERIRAYFDHAAGLTTLDGEAPSHVEVAGEDLVFHPADAVLDGETLVAASPDVPAPVAVRYGWGAADEPNLVNGAGLPASSFRSDDGPRVTQR